MKTFKEWVMTSADLEGSYPYPSEVAAHLLAVAEEWVNNRTDKPGTLMSHSSEAMDGAQRLLRHLQAYIHGKEEA